MECGVCHQDKDESTLIKCPLCHQHACEICRWSRHGRHFCSRECGETYFFEEDEEGEGED
jgi:hypothetical protein